MWGCAGHDPIRQDVVASSQTAGGSAAWALYLLVPLLLLLAAALLVCWMVMVRQRKALLLAEVNLHQQEIRSASLVFQLREATRRYKALEHQTATSQSHKDAGGPQPEDEDDFPDM